MVVEKHGIAQSLTISALMPWLVVWSNATIAVRRTDVASTITAISYFVLGATGQPGTRNASGGIK